jgi:predicted dehydrogenase
MKTVAVVGCGRIATGAHFPAFEAIGNVRVKYACDLIEEKAQAMKDKYSFVENVITDYNIALNDPEVEIVYVLTPNFAHYTVTMDALKAGKHVFCEKPITVNYKLSCEMAEAAEKAGKMLNIGVCNRYSAAVEKLAEMNKAGEFGDLYHVCCSFRAVRGIPGLGGAFTTKSQSGGGVLIDWGIHYLDLILFILGDAKIKSVSGTTYSKIGNDMKSYKYEGMWAEDTMDIENGTMDVDDFVTGFVRTDKGTITFNGAWAQNIGAGDTLIDFLGDKKGSRHRYCGDFDIFDGQTLETTTPKIELPNFYERETVGFFNAIDTGVKDRNNIGRILESMKLLDAIYRSAEEGKEIVL